MHLDLTATHAKDAYKILTSVVTPRPIALVTTINEDESINAAPFSFFNVLGASPPIVGFSPGDREPGIPKDTARNIRHTKEFVVHLVDEEIAKQMVGCAASWPYGVSELSAVGFTTTPSVALDTPRITEAPVALECEEWGTLQIGNNRLIIGKVLHVHARDGILDPVKLHIQEGTYRPIGRMHGPDGYCTTRDQMKIERPD